MDPLQLASSARALIQATAICSASIRDVREIPPAFGEVDRQLPIAERALTGIQEALRYCLLLPADRTSLEAILNKCQQRARQLEDVFARLMMEHDRTHQRTISWHELREHYREKVLGQKGYLVEELMNNVLAAIEKLLWHEAFHQVVGFRTNSREIRTARQRLEDVEPSLADAEFQSVLPKLETQSGSEQQTTSEPKKPSKPVVPSEPEDFPMSDDGLASILPGTSTTQNDIDAQRKPIVLPKQPIEAIVRNVQNLTQGGIGQQNIPQGGTNTFNAGEFVMTGEHANINFGKSCLLLVNPAKVSRLTCVEDSRESYLQGLFTLGRSTPSATSEALSGARAAY